ncbi:hypothetical protein [Microvirga calopogonii]|uniref:hypothetical protein n=1 Tax=Microvirga calopogonii TaxID=2078013 RepID=UPI000E0DB09C|nr:hypothetical protein [Microvirga calopogonii]
MADDPFDDVQDLVPISAKGDEEPAPAWDEAVAAEAPDVDADQLPPPEGFTPKEIQASVFGSSVQIYTSRKDERDYDGQIRAVKDAVTLFAICGNKQLISTIFEEVTAEHSHPYDVFARAQMEIEGMFTLPSET